LSFSLQNKKIVRTDTCPRTLSIRSADQQLVELSPWYVLLWRHL